MTHKVSLSQEHEAFHQAILKAIKGNEEKLMMTFIQQGPEELRKALHLEQDCDWNVVFDHLIFNKGLLQKCVKMFLPFFKQMVRQRGPLYVRSVLGIQDKLYDGVFDELFDFLAIAHGGVYDYVIDNSKVLGSLIRKGQGSIIRNVLCLNRSKYDDVWEEIVSQLFAQFAQEITHEQNCQHCLQVFKAVMKEVQFPGSLGI